MRAVCPRSVKKYLCGSCRHRRVTLGAAVVSRPRASSSPGDDRHGGSPEGGRAKKRQDPPPETGGKLADQKPPVKQGRDRGRGEDDAERGAGDHSRHAGEFGPDEGPILGPLIFGLGWSRRAAASRGGGIAGLRPSVWYRKGWLTQPLQGANSGRRVLPRCASGTNHTLGNPPRRAARDLYPRKQ
jgi:hypothetical protein